MGDASIMFRGSKVGPSAGFGSRPRTESGMDVGAPVHGRGSGSNPEAPKDMSETGRNDS